MSFILENWYLILMAVVSGGLLLWPGLRAGAGQLTPTQAVQLINKEKAVVLDVCEPAEYAAGHVAGARNVPLAGLSAESKGLPSNKAQPVIVVCATGARAAKAAGQLKQFGHASVHVLGGGLAAWREAGLPVEKA